MAGHMLILFGKRLSHVNRHLLLRPNEMYTSVSKKFCMLEFFFCGTHYNIQDQVAGDSPMYECNPPRP